MQDSSQAGAPRPRLIPGSDSQQGSIPASPQEQADLQQVMTKAGTMIHSRASRDQVLNSLHDPSGTIAQAVGRTAAHILMTVDQQKQASGAGALDHDVLLEAARHVIPELMDVGIAAGIFPIKPPPNQAQLPGPGAGSDPYNMQIKMAMLEATKVYGEQQLRRPDAHVLTQQAQDTWADKVRQEVSNGTADPKYLAVTRPQMSAPGGAGPALIQQPPPQGAGPSGA